MATNWDDFTPAGQTDWAQFEPADTPIFDASQAGKPKQNRGAISDIKTDLKRGLEELPGAVTGLADIPAGILGFNRPFSRGAEALGEATGFQPGKWAKEAEQEYSPARQQARANVNQAWDEGGAWNIARAYLADPSQIAGSIAESLPAFLAGGVIGRGAMAAGARGAAAAGEGALVRKLGQDWGSAVAGGLGEGAITAGQQMDQTDSAVDPRRAAVGALGAGVITGGIGAGSGHIANKLGIPTIETLGANVAGRKLGMKDWAKLVPASMAQEGMLEEFPQSMQEQAWQNWAEGKPVGEGVLRAGVEGALAGMGQGGGFTAVHGALNRRGQSAVAPPSINDTTRPTDLLAPPAPTLPEGPMGQGALFSDDGTGHFSPLPGPEAPVDLMGERERLIAGKAEVDTYLQQMMSQGNYEAVAQTLPLAHQIDRQIMGINAAMGDENGLVPGRMQPTPGQRGLDFGQPLQEHVPTDLLGFPLQAQEAAAPAEAAPQVDRGHPGQGELFYPNGAPTYGADTRSSAQQMDFQGVERDQARRKAYEESQAWGQHQNDQAAAQLAAANNPAAPTSMAQAFANAKPLPASSKRPVVNKGLLAELGLRGKQLQSAVKAMGGMNYDQLTEKHSGSKAAYVPRVAEALQKLDQSWQAQQPKGVGNAQASQPAINPTVAQAPLQQTTGERHDANPSEIPVQGQGQGGNAPARKNGVQPRAQARGRSDARQGQQAELPPASQSEGQGQTAAAVQEVAAPVTEAPGTTGESPVAQPTPAPQPQGAQNAPPVQRQKAAASEKVTADSDLKLVRDSIYGALDDASLTDEQVQGHVNFLYEEATRGTGKAKVEAAEALQLLQERGDGEYVEKAKAQLKKVQKAEGERATQDTLKQSIAEQFNAEHAALQPNEVMLDRDWRSFQSMMLGVDNLGDALDRLATARFASPAHRMLARLLAQSEAVRSAALTVRSEFKPSRHGDGFALGQYHEVRHHIYINGGGGTLSLLHEAVHAAVYNTMEADSKFKRKMMDLYLQVKAVLKGRADADEHYGMSDVQEFVAEAFVNPEFQKLLASIPSRQNVPTSPSLWQAFVDMVRAGLRLFGVHRSVLDDVVQGAAPYVGVTSETQAGEAVMPERAAIPLAEGLQKAAGLLNPGKSTKLEHTLNWLTLRQIETRYGDKLAGIKDYVKSVFARAAATTERVNRLTPLAERLDTYVRNTKERVALESDPKTKESPLAALLVDGDALEVDVRPDTETHKYRSEALKRWANDVSPEAEANHAAVQKLIDRYEALPADAQQLYQDMRAHFDEQAADTHAAMKQMVNSLIRDPEVRAARIQELNKWYSSRVTGYFPHMRFGNFFVSYRENGQKYVESYESERDADIRMANIEQMDGVIEATKLRRADIAQNNAFDLVTDLTQAIDKLDIDTEEGQQSPGALKQEIKDTLQEVWMKNLPEFSGAKFRLRRSGVKGYDTDVVRGVTAQGQRMARHIAHMEFMPAINASLVDMKDEVSGHPYAYVVTANHLGQPFSRVFPTRTAVQAWLSKDAQARDTRTQQNHFAYQGIAFARVTNLEDANEHFAGAAIPEAQWPTAELQQLLAAFENQPKVRDLSEKGALFNHIRKMNGLNAQTESSKIINGITQLGWLYHLGLTPSFAVINMLQVPSIHTPWLAARVGTRNAIRHTWDAYKLIGKHLGDLAKATWQEDVLKALETPLGKDSLQLKMLRTMMERNLIDFTTSYDLTAMARGESGAWADKKRQALKVAAYAAQYTEVLNRLVTALSTYNAAKARAMEEDKAIDLTTRALAETQGDYSPENTAYAMDRRRTGPLSLMFQFQKYRQFTLYGLADNVMKVFGKDAESRKIARATLVGWAASNGVLFGTLGVPAAFPLLWMLSALGGGGDDKDEPIDPVRDLKRFYAAITGSDEVAEVLTHGMFRTLGISVTGRAGMGDIIPGTRGLIDPKQTSEKDYNSTMQAVAFDIFAGPAGGIASNAANAMAFFAQGNWYRGLESMAPKAVKDVMTATRYANEGVMSRNGQTRLMADVDADAVLVRALGFTPAEIANLYENRGSLQAIADHLNNGKTRVKNAYTAATMFGDTDDRDAAMQRWQEWNATHTGKARVAYSDLVKSVSQARKREQEIMHSDGLYSSKQTRQLVQPYLE